VGKTAHIEVNTALNFRVSPWGKIQGTFSPGDQVKVLGIEGDWVKISYNGKTGYAHGSYLRPGAGSSSPSNPVVSSGGSFGGKPVTGRVTSKYGMRLHPIDKVYKMHTGVDVGAPRGTPVYALGAGKIISASWNGGYGRLVKVQFDNGMVGYYAHLDSFEGMTAGRRVEKGEVVGKVDSTGNSTGNHLHLELRKNGNPVDPTTVSGVQIG
jgi:murein DD-endopeptidase MepM/ murein hydrolase activator NlpD